MKWLQIMLVCSSVVGCAHIDSDQTRFDEWIRESAHLEVRPLPEDIDPATVTALQVRELDPTKEVSGTQRGGVLLYTSDRFDPCDQGGPCGYWIILTQNDKTEHLYTAVTRLRPYILLSGGGYPHRDGDFVLVVAQRADLAEWSVSEKRDPQLLLLRFDLRVLRQDSDHDGLTDLEERRLLTSPMNPDTDADGRRDSEDINPLVKFDARAQGRIGLLRQTLLEHHLGPTDRLVLIRSEDGFDLPDARFRVLTLGGPQLEQYQASFGSRWVHEVTLGGCGDTPCDRTTRLFSWPEARHELRESDLHAIIEFSDESSTFAYHARWDGDHWTLERAGLAIAGR